MGFTVNLWLLIFFVNSIVWLMWIYTSIIVTGHWSKCGLDRSKWGWATSVAFVLWAQVLLLWWRDGRGTSRNVYQTKFRRIYTKVLYERWKRRLRMFYRTKDNPAWWGSVRRIWTTTFSIVVRTRLLLLPWFMLEKIMIALDTDRMFFIS